jgi:hypothetical protein
MRKPITQARSAKLLAGFKRSAFHWEAQSGYKIAAEAVPLAHFLETGELLPPSQFGWWQEWLNSVAAHDRHGRTVQRVRVLSEPPTPYQRYLLAIGHWHAGYGDHAFYIPRSRAVTAGLPLTHDWWLLDSSRVILASFTPEGEVAGKEVITGENAVRPYLHWRNLALLHASAAEDIAAAVAA